MNKKNIRFYVSKVSIYMFLFGILFLLQRFFIVNLLNVKQYVLFGRFYTYEIILAIITCIELKLCTKITKPE